MKLLLITIAIFLTQVAVANQMSCSNADQSFSFVHRTSNGGAPLDWKEIAYNADRAKSSSHNDPYISMGFAKRTKLSTSSRDNATVTVFSAKASGSFTNSEGKEVVFNDLWVICSDEKYPVCPQCP